MIKQILCKDHKFQTITNLHGDMINLFNGYRSIKECIICGKIKYDLSLDSQCKNINKI